MNSEFYPEFQNSFNSHSIKHGIDFCEIFRLLLIDLENEFTTPLCSEDSNVDSAHLVCELHEPGGLAFTGDAIYSTSEVNGGFGVLKINGG